jgi:glycosyltransferase involved in cell wall biosynthesis
LKVLQICFRVPYPPEDGGAIAMFGVTRNLYLKGCDVTVLAVNTPKHFQSDHVLGEIARLIPVFIDTTISPIKALKNLFKTIPYIVERFISNDFLDALQKLLQEEVFDVIHFEGTFVAWYVDEVRRLTKTPVVLRSHNLEFMIWERLARNEKNPFKKIYFKKMASELKAFELKYYQKFDAIATITSEDGARLKDLGITTPIDFIPAGVDLDRFPLRKDIQAKTNTCFMLGSLNWMPNQEALFWFLDYVWEKVQQKLPFVELHIAGSGTPEHIKNLKINNVFVHGFVDSASDFMQQYDLMLVPLLSGGGMRLKIIEGMAVNKIILSSVVGAEGIDCTDGKNIVICNDAQEWVDKLVDYFENSEQHKLIGVNAGNLIKEKYANTIVIEKLIELYKSLKN